jgi:hypothetical protein
MDRPACIDGFLLQVERFNFILQFSHRCAHFYVLKLKRRRAVNVIHVKQCKKSILFYKD